MEQNFSLRFVEVVVLLSIIAAFILPLFSPSSSEPTAEPEAIGSLGSLHSSSNMQSSNVGAIDYDSGSSAKEVSRDLPPNGYLLA
jgi:hypothetical protein